MKWIDPKIKRPKDGDKIICTHIYGIGWGTYHSIQDGQVFNEGKKFDIVDWRDVYEWIIYPTDF